MSPLFAIAFTIAAVLLWWSVFGYLLVLTLIARRRRRTPLPMVDDCPAVTVILAIRDEEALLAAKLDDLQRTLYPAERLRFLIVDGGSRDRSLEIVRGRIAAGAPFDLLEVPSAVMKSDQLAAGLSRARTDIVVATDADGRLAPDCVRRLVDELVADSALGAVAATVEPASELVEERLHWSLQNLLWWAEGEAFDAAMGSGVALAFRRSAVPQVPQAIAADDAFIMMRAAERGGARLCRQARAEELRAPRSLAEFLAFRRRRGEGYRQVLERYALSADAPLGARLTWAVRRWHFRVFPLLVAATVLGAVLACLSPQWPVVAAMTLFFVVSLVLTERRVFVRTRHAGLFRLFLPAARALVVDCASLVWRSARDRALARSNQSG